MSKKILIVCTGNSCRSQMAEGFLKSFDTSLEVYSAGVRPEKEVNPNSIAVMNEAGIDISMNRPKSIEQFENDRFDFVITVCDFAKSECTNFSGQTGKKIHIGFEDPADAQGTPDEILNVYRTVRDKIRYSFHSFYESELK